MADIDIFASYVNGIDALLTPSDPRLETARSRDGEAVKPPSPFDDAQILQAQQLLQQQPQVVVELLNRWQAATTAQSRSVEEVRILGSAAADLAMAERLLYGVVDESEIVEAVERSDTTGGDEETIRLALTNPEALLTPARLPGAYRAPEDARDALLAATYASLEGIKQGAADASVDAITGLLSRDLLLLKEAAEFVSKDLVDQLLDISISVVKSAVEYLLSATDKLKLLMTPQAQQQMIDGALDLLDKIGDDKSVMIGLGKLLATDAVYNEASGWIRGYTGSMEAMPPLTEQIVALQGSYAGRVKLLKSIAKGLAIAGRLLALGTVTIAWAPLAIVGAYIAMVAYALYSAFDHIDSTRFPYFDRVVGVRTVVQQGLAVSPAAG
ncbi:MAG: hypothetical protein J5I90_04015 [Caldilineales bacterium]|nr:hypothetical protein [Caldilineales bacterium]